MIGSLRVALCLLLFVPVTAFCALGQALSVSTGLFCERRMPRLWHRFILRLLAMRVHVSGRLPEDRPLLVVSNHVSWTDIMVIGSVLDVHFIARGDMADWPIMGRLARLQRTVFVERGTRSRSAAQAREIASRLGSGDAMVLFAEGTTGDGGGVLPFKSTLFAAAQIAAREEAAIAVQPVAVVYARSHGVPLGRLERVRYAWIGDQSLLPHLTFLLRGGAVDVHLMIGEPIVAAGDTDRKALAREAEARVRALAAKVFHGSAQA